MVEVLDNSRDEEFKRIDKDKREIIDNEISDIKSKLERLKDEKRRDEGKLNRNKIEQILDNKYIICGIAIIIIILSIYLRIDMLGFQGFFEPDGFFHYSVIMQSIANNFIVPMHSIYSGFYPNNNPITEPAGLYYVTLIPYFFLRYFGISAYTIERLVPVLFGILDTIAAYFVIKYISKSRVLGLLAMLMVAVSSGDTARTSALVYRGDGFITIFLLFAIFLIFKGLENNVNKKKYIYFIAAAIVLGVGTGVWNGAPFTIVVYILAVLLLIIYGFIKANIKLIKDTVILSLVLLVTIFIQHLFMAVNIIRGGQALSSIHILIFYLPILIGSILSYIILSGIGPKKLFERINENATSRIIFLIAIAVISVLIMLSLFFNYIVSIATGQGLVVAGTPLTVTIEELQRPSFQFLWVSFSLELFLAPIGVLLYIIFRMHKIEAFEEIDTKIMDYAFIIILAYLLATGYLQANAVRFNSLVAVPIAIFSAYAIYVIGRIAYYYSIKKPTSFTDSKNIKIALFAVILLIIAIVSGYTTYMAYQQSSTLFQADGINQYFLNATLWIKNTTNTPANATFLAVWPDGSVIEGFGQRQSLMDSVGGQNSAEIYNFSDFLFNDTPDTQYLYKIGKPNYLFVRNFWYQELGGIAIEGSVKNTTAYGIDALQGYQPQYNRTINQTVFPFESYPYRAIVVTRGNSNKYNMSAYISYQNSSFIPLRNILLYSELNGTSSTISLSPNSINYTLFVQYTLNGNSIDVTGATLLGPSLPNSNVFKFLSLCNSNYCPYDNSNVSLQLVYQNPDSKIFKIIYK